MQESGTVSQNDNEDEACMEVANYSLPSPEHLITNFQLHIKKNNSLGQENKLGLKFSVLCPFRERVSVFDVITL